MINILRGEGYDIKRNLPIAKNSYEDIRQII